MLTALPDAINDLTLPCHEQRAGAATGLSCLLTGRRKTILLFGNRISCIIIYVMKNLVNPRAWWQCSIKITVLFVGRCSPGKFHQVDSASTAVSLRWVW